MTQQQIQKPVPQRAEDEVIEELPASVTSEVTSSTDELLDELEDVIAVSDAMSDDLLMDAVATQKVETVPNTGRSAFQSHSARAWTMGGRVD